MHAKPNILWILTTQWRGQALGYAGDPNARTPTLDALARESLVFSQAITPHPFGPFARAALLTGLRSPENGLRDYYDPLPAGASTLPRQLRALGYRSLFFGKWHLSARDPAAPLVGDTHARQRVPLEARGDFDFWEGFESGFQLNDCWLQGNELPEPRQFPGYQSRVLVERCQKHLQGPQPWFCILSLESPHPPYAAPADGIQPPEPGTLSLPANVPRGGDVEAKARAELSGYYAHTEATDRALAPLLGSLDLENTVVVFTSVHGDMHGAHGLFRKGWPYEESIRVPLLIRPPGKLSKSRTSEQPVAIDSLHGWTLDWAREGWREAHGTTDLAQCSMPSVVRLPFQGDRSWRCLRSSKRKLVLNEDGSPWLFFDLVEDPLETRNLVGDPARRVEIDELRKLLSSHHGI